MDFITAILFWVIFGSAMAFIFSYFYDRSEHLREFLKDLI